LFDRIENHERDRFVLSEPLFRLAENLRKGKGRQMTTNGSHPGVVLKETLVRVRRKWMLLFILANVFYGLAIAGLLIMIPAGKNTISSLPDIIPDAISSVPDTKKIMEEYRTKDKLYGILRTKGYSLGQGIDIVETIIRKSKELELPLALIMAVIDRESEFYPNARSNMGAQGLMQIMPFKWDAYVAKLRLSVERRAMTDPLMNITVGCEILKDFYIQNGHITDHKLRMAKALTDYNNGEEAINPNLDYAVQVSRKQSEYEEALR
jgi:soluble lytic murein transglycosylase-like protein